MKCDDTPWILLYISLAAITVALVQTGLFGRFNEHFPYPAGFVQFAIYATAGELFSTRVLRGAWIVNRATLFKAGSWGFSGLFVTLAFRVFSDGSRAAMEAGLLPFVGSALALAFFTSCTNNIFFGPLHSAFIRVCCNYADLRYTEHRRITVREAVNSVDWGELVTFTLFRTIPLFWIPVNTVGFLLPLHYRIVFASVLSMAFGVLMTILKLRERRSQTGWSESDRK